MIVNETKTKMIIPVSENHEIEVSKLDDGKGIKIMLVISESGNKRRRMLGALSKTEEANIRLTYLSYYRKDYMNLKIHKVSEPVRAEESIVFDFDGYEFIVSYKTHVEGFGTTVSVELFENDKSNVIVFYHISNNGDISHKLADSVAIVGGNKEDSERKLFPCDWSSVKRI